jgi:hypothetical protein
MIKRLHPDYDVCVFLSSILKAFHSRTSDFRGKKFHVSEFPITQTPHPEKRGQPQAWQSRRNAHSVEDRLSDSSLFSQSLDFARFVHSRRAGRKTKQRTSKKKMLTRTVRVATIASRAAQTQQRRQLTTVSTPVTKAPTARQLFGLGRPAVESTRVASFHTACTSSSAYFPRHFMFNSCFKIFHVIWYL